MSALRASIPSYLRIYIEDKDLSEKAFSVNEAGDYQDALKQEKDDLRTLANIKSDEYAKYKAKLEKKEKSSKKEA